MSWVGRLSLLLLLASLALPAAAAAVWSAPVTLAMGVAFDARVAVDPSGNAVFVWARPDATTDCGGARCTRIQTRTRSAAGALSATVTLSDPGHNAAGPTVGVDQNGNATFGWTLNDGTTDCGGFGCDRLQARARTAAGVLSATQTLSAPGRSAFISEVAVDPNGNAVFVWERFDGTARRIQARARTAAGVLSAIQTLSAPGQNASFPQVAVDPNGNAVFAWEFEDGTTDCGGFSCTRIQARARSAAGALSAPRTLSAAGAHASHSQVAVDPSGNAVFVWQRPDATTDCEGFACGRIQARARTAAGVLSATHMVSGAGQSAETPRVAVDPSGNAVIAWVRSDATTACDGGGCRRIQIRTRSPVGALSAIQTLSGPDHNSDRPDVAVDPNGNAVFVWERPDTTTACDGGACVRIQARSRTAAGVLSAPKILSVPREHAGDPRVAVDSSGNAVAAWRVTPNRGIRAATGP